MMFDDFENGECLSHSVRPDMPQASRGFLLINRRFSAVYAGRYP
jgi:hypothetical protein